MKEYVDKLRITTLIENTSSRGGILGEFALSMLVETDEISILFDCGRGFSTVYNATALGLDLSRVDKTAYLESTRPKRPIQQNDYISSFNKEEIITEANVIDRVRETVLEDVANIDEDGRLIAKSRGTYFIMKKNK